MNCATENFSHPANRNHHESTPTSLFIIANQDIYVDGLTRIIADLPDIEVVKCISPDNDCHRHYAENPADILMIEQSIAYTQAAGAPAGALFEPFTRIRPDLRTIIFGHDMEDIFVRRMLSAGAHGFIDSSTTPQLLGIAINEVRDGGYWLGRSTLQHLIQAVSEMERIVEQGIADKIEDMKDKLTKRETDVLQRVLGGMSTREIAADLHLSEQSIKLHLGHLFRKFEVSNRSQLILMAFKRVCPVNNMIQLFRRSLDRRNIAQGRPPAIKDPLTDMS